VDIFGFHIYYYALFIALGVLLGAVYMLRNGKDYGLTSDNILDGILLGIPLGVIFSRLWHVVFHFGYYRDNPITIITGMRDGGLAIYGVIVGAALAAWICSRWRRVPFLSYVDGVSISLLIGQVVGRWGNFMNRELYGTPTDLPWRMGLTVGETTTYVHPIFLYESLWNALGIVLLHLYSKKVGRKYPGQIFVFYLGWYGFGRAWIETLRAPHWTTYIFDTGISANMVLAMAAFLVAVAVNHIMTKRTRQPEPTPEAADEVPEKESQETLQEEPKEESQENLQEELPEESKEESTGEEE